MNHNDASRLIFSVVKRVPAVMPYLNDKAQGIVKAANALSGINRKYHDAITKALIGYFEGGSITTARNAFKKATSQAVLDAFEAGWQDAGADLPLDEDSQAWVSDYQQSQFGFIEALFQDAARYRKQKDFDYFTWVNNRADGYTGSLVGVYNAGSMLANGKQMATWELGQTEKHCPTCLKLNGQRHRLGWFVAKNYIPRKPGAAMACQGYHCDCKFKDDNGNEILLGG